MMKKKYISVQDIMEQLEGVGWVKASQKESQEITELDFTEIFNMIDVDKSGLVSRRVNFLFFTTTWKSTILGGKVGRQASRKKVWYKRCKQNTVL